MANVPVFTGVLQNPYPHYTQCVTAADYNTQNQYLQAILATLLGGGVAIAIESALGATPWCYALAVEVGVLAGGLAYCNWWLNDRLVCLPADVTAASGPAIDVCAVGMFVKDEQLDPTPIPYSVANLDTDWTMDIVLYGTQPGQPDDILITEQTAYSDLVSQTNSSFNLDSKLQWNGKTDSFSVNSPQGPVTITDDVLHCEVEGAGILEYKNWLQVLFWMAVSGLIAQEALSAFPPAAAAVSAVVALLVFLLSILGFYVSENNQANKPAPGGAYGPSSIAFVPPGSPSNVEATIVCVIGTWVSDTVHGYNEIHPVKFLQQVGGTEPDPDGSYPWPEYLADQCGMVSQATAAAVISTQTQPTNGWLIHPLVDGCGIYPPDPPVPTTE